MGRRLVNIDRDTPMLLPPSLQDWVGEDDMARLVLDAVSLLEEEGYHYNWRGTGSAQYPPALMLALLIYCYANGIFSSRKIERATYRDVAVRFIMGDTHPDHDTIAAFRRQNADLFKSCFVKVLQLARQLGLKQMGEVSLDGSIITARGSRKQVHSQQELKQQLLAIEQQVEALIKQAEAVDQSEGAGPLADSLPAALRQAQQRRARLQQALAALERQSQQRAEQRQVERDEFDWEGPGEPPRKRAAKPKATDTLTLSEPEARLLPLKQGGFAPAYNVQLAVEAQSAVPLILATGLSDEPGDRRQLLPVVTQLLSHAPQTQCVGVDAGYDNVAQIYQLQQQHPDLTIYCPLQERARPHSPDKRLKQPSACRQRTAVMRQQMRERLESEAGQRSQRLRRVTVEPVFGWIKHTLGFTRFNIRGLRGASLEWDLVCLGCNLATLHRFKAKSKQAKAAQRLRCLNQSAFYLKQHLRFK